MQFIKPNVDILCAEADVGAISVAVAAAAAAGFCGQGPGATHRRPGHYIFMCLST